jgi:Domain of unknown function (DUF2027)/Smr domain
MNFSVGDKVSLLNEKGGGIIFKLLNSEMVIVMLDEGFEIPFHISQIVPIHSNFPTTKKQEETITTLINKVVPLHNTFAKAEFSQSVFLAFTLENENHFQSSALNIWLINYTAYHLLFNYTATNRGKTRSIANGQLQPGEKTLMATAQKSEIENYCNCMIEGVFFKKEEYNYKSFLNKTMRIKKTKFVNEKLFTPNSLLEANALLIDILKDEESNEKTTTAMNLQDIAAKFEKEQARFQSPPKSKPANKNVPVLEMEIDLHIEKLVDFNYKQLSNGEIIEIQLQQFKRSLDQALANNCKRLIVIHGVGTGKLKQEVHQLLKKWGYIFYDASYAKYGSGATEVKL